MSILSVKNMCISLQGHDIVRDVNFKTQGVTMLLGPNGCGKSTLMRGIMGIIPAKGTAETDGQDVISMGVRKRARIISYLPQRQTWNNAMSVRDYVSMGASVSGGMFAPPDKNAMEKADSVIENLGISHISRRSMNRLSGGETRVAGIARAIAQGGQFMIMDEPLAGLDYRKTHEILGIIRKYCPDCLISIHDPALAWQYGDRVLLMENGVICAQGVPGDEAAFEGELQKVYGKNIEFTAVHGRSLPMHCG